MASEHLKRMLNEIDVASKAFRIDQFERTVGVLEELTVNLAPCTRTTDAVIQVAVTAAACSSTGYIATVHFVFALLSVRQSIAEQLIARAGIGARMLKKEIYDSVRGHHVMEDGSSLDRLLSGPDVAPFLAYSRDSMVQAGDRRIHTGHLWAGAVQLHEASQPLGLWKTINTSDLRDSLGFHGDMEED